MSAARTLGWPQTGLAAILDTHFGVKLNKKYQRSNWKLRPLKPEQLNYAQLDTHYLVALRDRQIQALTASGQWPEAQEDFARLVRGRGDSNHARALGAWLPVAVPLPAAGSGVGSTATPSKLDPDEGILDIGSPQVTAVHEEDPVPSGRPLVIPGARARKRGADDLFIADQRDGRHYVSSDTV